MQIIKNISASNKKITSFGKHLEEFEKIYWHFHPNGIFDKDYIDELHEKFIHLNGDKNLIIEWIVNNF